jgi:hypothetical protein
MSCVDLTQAAALTGGARDGSGKLLTELSAAAPWRQQHLAKLGLSGGGPKQNLQVCNALFDVIVIRESSYMWVQSPFQNT